VWLKLWAQSSDQGRTTVIKDMIIFIALTLVNITLMGIWLAYAKSNIWLCSESQLILERRHRHFTMVFMPRSSLSLHASQLKALMRYARGKFYLNHSSLLTYYRASFAFIVATDTGTISNHFSQDMVLIDGPLPSAWINVTSGKCFIILRYDVASTHNHL
jgi:ATP-binding cassette subfamily C (CFTR/MRP) protein 1